MTLDDLQYPVWEVPLEMDAFWNQISFGIKEVKMIAGMAPTTGSDDVRSQLHLDGIVDSSNLDIANLINTALLEPLQAYSPLACLPPAMDDSEVLTVNSSEVCNALLGLNLREAGGPDGLNNWLL